MLLCRGIDSTEVHANIYSCHILLQSFILQNSYLFLFENATIPAIILRWPALRYDA